MYYFRHRQYDPVHGRFLSRDPLGPVDSFCLYQFVNNSPMNFLDPMGLEVKVVKASDFIKQRIAHDDEIMENLVEKIKTALIQIGMLKKAIAAGGLKIEDLDDEINALKANLPNAGKLADMEKDFRDRQTAYENGLRAAGDLEEGGQKKKTRGSGKVTAGGICLGTAATMFVAGLAMQWLPLAGQIIGGGLMATSVFVALKGGMLIEEGNNLIAEGNNDIAAAIEKRTELSLEKDKIDKLSREIDDMKKKSEDINRRIKALEDIRDVAGWGVDRLKKRLKELRGNVNMWTEQLEFYRAQNSGDRAILRNGSTYEIYRYAQRMGEGLENEYKIVPDDYYDPHDGPEMKPSPFET